MTTVISRLYKDKNTANKVEASLHDAGFPKNTVDVLSASDGGDLTGAMAHARVPKSSAAIYVSEMDDTASVLLVVRAPFTPFGAAREAMKIVDETPSLPSAVTKNDVLVRDEPNRDLFLNVMTKHPLFLTSKREMSRNDGRISRGLGWSLLSRPKARTSAISGGRLMSKMFWPMAHLSTKKGNLSVYRGGKKFLTS